MLPLIFLSCRLKGSFKFHLLWLYPGRYWYCRVFSLINLSNCFLITSLDLLVIKMQASNLQSCRLEDVYFLIFSLLIGFSASIYLIIDIIKASLLVLFTYLSRKYISDVLGDVASCLFYLIIIEYWKISLHCLMAIYF